MRRLLLLSALCMALALSLSAPAMAQSASPSPDEPCPADIDQFPEGTVCGEGGGYVTPDASSPSASASASASPAAGEDVDCGDFASQFGAQQFYDFNSPPGDPYNLDADGDGLACEESSGDGTSDDGSASSSASSTASATASASALPETGGPSPTGLALPSLALLIAGGVFAARLVRR